MNGGGLGSFALKYQLFERIRLNDDHAKIYGQGVKGKLNVCVE